MSIKSENIFRRLFFFQKFEEEKEIDFHHDLFQRSIGTLRGAIVFSVFLFLAFAWLDIHIAPIDYWAMWVFRFIYCLYAVLIFAYSFTVFFEPLNQLVMGSLVVVAAICLLGIMLIPIDVSIANIYYSAFILLVFFNFTMTNLKLEYAFFMAISIVILYLLVGVFYLEVLIDGWVSTTGVLFISNVFFLTMSISMGAIICAIIERYRRKDYLQRLALKEEQGKSSELLLNILPHAIAERLKQSPETIADEYEQVSILFADLVGFTKLASQKTPKELVDMLDTVFSKFDWLTNKYGLEKIKTIGDAYMVAGGLLGSSSDHPRAMADMALSMQRELEKYNRRFGTTLQLRIGIHIGPVVAGVIGSNKFSYDMWGDAVNIASRMESTSVVGEIQVSTQVYQAIKGYFTLLPRGEVEMKGKGSLFTYFLKG